MTDDELDELVEWQLSGWKNRKAPVPAGTPLSRVLCPNCTGEWHGLPHKNGCRGSFADSDTPQGVN